MIRKFLFGCLGFYINPIFAKITRMTFQDLNLPKSLQKAIDDVGYLHPTPIQSKALPVISSSRDVIGIAQTGTGKTWAYLLPILKHWKFVDLDIPRVLIVVPTRELVVQVADEVQKLSAYMSIKIVSVYGGTNINTQKKALSEGADIVVGTPGRILDLMLDAYLRTDAIQKLVIDEFDEILQLGFKSQMIQMLSLIKSKRQHILFSATMTDDVDEMIEEYFNFPIEVSLAPSGTPLEKIDQKIVSVPNFLTKINVLKYWLNSSEIEKALIFVNNKKLVDLVYEMLSESGFEDQIELMHSNKSQNYRLQAIQKFHNNEVKAMITTDIMARGLDISNVSHVINIDLPLTPEQYIHRIGRTGRADKQGIAWSMISHREEEQLLDIEVLMEKEIEWIDMPDVDIEQKLLEFEKNRVKPKQLIKTQKIEVGAAFHQKKEKNKKVNLGGPGKRKPKTGSKGNRGANKFKSKKK